MKRGMQLNLRNGILGLDSGHLIGDPSALCLILCPLISSLSLTLPLRLTHPPNSNIENQTMNVLDSPLEALALNYLSFGFLTLFNNLWTWVAVATAAVSFWRIRAAGCPKPELELPCDEPISTRPDPVPEVVMPADAGRERALPPALVQTVVGDSNGDVNVHGVTKGKFTVYYEDFKECGESGELLAVTEEWKEREDRSEGEWWERLLRMRKGESENGWYTWQDLTELNGNVVRLWDGGFTTRESWHGSTQSCIHVW